MDSITALFGNPSYPYQISGQFNTVKVQFDDGYTQTRPKGLHSAPRKLTLTWTEREASTMRKLHAWLIARLGTTAFIFEDPFTAEQIKVRCEDFPDFSQQCLPTATVTAVLQEVF